LNLKSTDDPKYITYQECLSQSQFPDKSKCVLESLIFLSRAFPCTKNIFLSFEEGGAVSKSDPVKRRAFPWPSNLSLCKAPDTREIWGISSING
jgi:hypothetical protein